jgi:exopolyphosphatase/guanosine-5'-triphosphate,3'-diphosphate pyrophosphatase
MSRLAVVDIGTNSIHMVLAEIQPDFSYKIVDRFKDPTRLGDGTFKTKRLSEAAMSRGMEILRNLTTLAKNKGFDRIVATATSAVREAKNGGEFLKKVANQTGLRVRVVTGQEEARLIYLGVRHSMELSEGPTLIVDVGGGSVELVACNEKRMLFGKSLKLGAIRLKDLFLRSDLPTRSMAREMEKLVDRGIQSALKAGHALPFKRIVATSGMAGNLTEIVYLRRTGRPVPQLNLASVTMKEVDEVEQLLKKKDPSSRLNIPGLDPKRVDTLYPAAVVLHRVMKYTGHHTMMISDKAIREGVIYDFIQRHQEGIRAEKEIPSIRRRQVILLGRRCHYPEAHSNHVATLALSLYDQMKSLHHLGDQEREWLEFAALLHDVGYLIHGQQHHKHSYYLIKHGDLSGFTAEEVDIIANVARYHRRALPQTAHSPFKALSKKQRQTVEVLSALLRVADGLDRSHFAVVKGLHVRLDESILIALQCTGDSELEKWAAESRADLFVKVFQHPIEIFAQSGNGQNKGCS